MTVKTFNRSFAGGEISPQLFARLDLDKFQTGLALCENCETLPQGPVQNRAGFGYILETKFSGQRSVLIPFSFNTEQTFALEFGDFYIRFHTNGGTLLEDGVNINAITQAANPVYTLSAPPPWLVGDWVFLSGISGMTGLNGRWVIVNSISGADVQLTDLWGQPIDTSAMPPYALSGSMARVYEVATPYAAADLDTIKYVQSADVLTLVSPLYPPAELRRNGATNWTLADIVFATSLSPPQGGGTPPSGTYYEYFVLGFIPEVGWTAANAPASAIAPLGTPGYFVRVSWSTIAGAITYYIFKQGGGSPIGVIGTPASGNTFDDYGIPPNTSVPLPGPVVLPALTVSATPVAPASAGVSVTPTGAGAIVYRYVVTSYNSDTGEESIASAEGSGTNDLSVSGNFNTVTWPAVPGVSEYNVYRYMNGLWGFVGPAGSDCVFVDQNILPDTSTTPPIQLNPFLGEGNYPRTVSYFQQRRVFASTNLAPQTVWMTRSATEKNLGYSIPSRDDDGIVLRVVSREANTIRSMVPMNDLILLTSGGEWKLGAPDGGAITPTNLNVSPQGYVGTADVQPASTDRTILFPQDRGGGVRELIYSWEQAGYQTSDVTILAPHLFQYHTVRRMAFARSPLPSLWVVRDDGRLLGLTYVPQQEVRAWHQHVTDGAFESVCSVAEGDEDVLYTIVRREVNLRTVRYVERKHTRRFDTPADQFFVDSGVSYDGPETDTLTGLWHLEGKSVAILADGGVVPPQVVTGGAVTLDAPASKVHVGLPYVARFRTLPLSVQTQAFGQGVVKNVNKVFLRVYQSQTFKAGPGFDKLREYQTRFQEPYGSPPELITGEVPLTLSPRWDTDAAVCVEQSDPISLMVLGIALETATGS